MTSSYSLLTNNEIKTANDKAVTDVGADSFTAGGTSTTNIIQSTFTGVTQSGTVNINHDSDVSRQRMTQVFEFVASQDNVVNTSLDFDLVDAGNYIQEDSVSGTEFIAGKVALKYDETQGYFTGKVYVTTSDSNHITTNNIRYINSCTISYDAPTGTDLSVLLSFDSRGTWNTWNGTSFVDATTNFNNKTNWCTISNIESGLTNYTVTSGITLDFAFLLESSDTTKTPYIDQVTLDYDEYGFYLDNTSSDYTITYDSDTTTKITKVSSGTANIKVSTILP